MWPLRGVSRTLIPVLSLSTQPKQPLTDWTSASDDPKGSDRNVGEVVEYGRPLRCLPMWAAIEDTQQVELLINSRSVGSSRFVVTAGSGRIHFYYSDYCCRKSL